MVVKSEDKVLEGRTSPSYVKVRGWLLDYIVEQNLQSGDRIPSERVLAERLGLSRPKVARAVAELVDEKVLVREYRSGTFMGARSGKKPSNSTRVICLVKAWPESVMDEFDRVQPLFDNIIQSATAAMKEQGYRAQVIYSNLPEDEARILDELSNDGVEGAIIYPAISHDMDRICRVYASHDPTTPPIVLVDHYFPSLPIDHVVSDNFSGARDAVRLLISKGHRRIAFFTDFSAITSVMDRDAGYRAALEEADIDYDESLVCGPQVMRHSRLNYDYTLEHLLKLPEPVTAIFGINDNTIWAALQAANVQGLQVPRDLEIAGFFDSPIPMGVQTHFIRVVQAKYEMGRAAVQVILDRLSGDTSKEPRHVLIPPTVVE